MANSIQVIVYPAKDLTKLLKKVLMSVAVYSSRRLRSTAMWWVSGNRLNSGQFGELFPVGSLVESAGIINKLSVQDVKPCLA
jgi:hypothetical protein